MSINSRPSSEKPQALQEASKDFFGAIMNGEFATLSEERIQAMTNTRGAAGGILAHTNDSLAYDYPGRLDPKRIDRTPSEQMEVADWRRTPLAPESAEKAA